MIPHPATTEKEGDSKRFFLGQPFGKLGTEVGQIKWIQTKCQGTLFRDK